MKFIFSLWLLLLTVPLQSQDLNASLVLPAQQLSFGQVVELMEANGYQLAYGNVKDSSMVIAFSSRQLKVKSVLEQTCTVLHLKYKVQGGKIIFFPGTRPPRFTLSGYVYDKATGEALIGVSFFDTLSKSGTTSNLYGFFSYTAPSGTPIRISYLGYKDSLLILRKNEDLKLVLVPSQHQIGEVEVFGQRHQETQMSIVSLSPKEIELLPNFMGEPDVIKALTLMPGVSSGNDFSGGFYVRGGGPDQNLLLIDGANIYNSTHAFDLFSTFNADAIKQVDLIKGGFPARYGGRLSSVMDVRLREGNSEKLTGEVGLGYLLSSATIEGPLLKGKGSFLLTGRRTFLDLFSEPISQLSSSGNQQVKQNIVFYDFSGKVNFQLSERDRIFFSFYQSQDKFSVFEKITTSTPPDGESKETTDIGFSWSNQVFSSRWNHRFSNKLFLNTTATYSRFRLNTDIDIQLEGVENEEEFFTKTRTEFRSNIRDYGIHTQFDYYPHPRHSVKFGSSSIYHKTVPGASNVHNSNSTSTQNLDTLLGNQKIGSVENFLFLEDEWDLHPRLKLNLGLHAALLLVEKKNYPSLQPRTALSYSLTEQWSLKASYAEMSQFLHLLTNSSLGIPLDLWVPATPDAPPMRSRQLALGINWKAPSQRYMFSIETYYKQMRNLIAYKEGAVFTDAKVPWQEKIVTNGKGDAYGAEFFVRKSKGPLTGWIGYTLSWSNRQFKELNAGETYPYKYDRRHDASVVAMYRFNKKVNLSASWVYATGNSVTFPKGTYPTLGSPGDQNGFNSGPLNNETWEYGPRNSVRLPSYHRLDLGINLSKEKKHGTRSWNFSLYNSYLRKNAFFIFWDTEVDLPSSPFGYPQEKRILQQVSAFWIVPSVTYTFKFN